MPSFHVHALMVNHFCISCPIKFSLFWRQYRIAINYPIYDSEIMITYFWFQSGFTLKLFKVYCCTPIPSLLSLQAREPQHIVCSYKIEKQDFNYLLTQWENCIKNIGEMYPVIVFILNCTVPIFLYSAASGLWAFVFCSCGHSSIFPLSFILPQVRWWNVESLSCWLIPVEQMDWLLVIEGFTVTFLGFDCIGFRVNVCFPIVNYSPR